MLQDFEGLADNIKTLYVKGLKASKIKTFSKTKQKSVLIIKKNILKLDNKNNRTEYPANIYLFKVNNRNTRKRCEICSKLTIKTPERLQ